MIYKSLAALALLVAPAMASADPVTVLNAPISAHAASPGNRADVRLVIGPYHTRAVVFVTAWGESNYQGPSANAGILVSIRVGDSPLARDDSFDSRSSNITYRAAASHNFVLPAGQRITVWSSTEPYGSQSAANNNTQVTMTLIALAAQ